MLHLAKHEYDAAGVERRSVAQQWKAIRRERDDER